MSKREKHKPKALSIPSRRDPWASLKEKPGVRVISVAKKSPRERPR